MKHDEMSRKDVPAIYAGILGDRPNKLIRTVGGFFTKANTFTKWIISKHWPVLLNLVVFGTWVAMDFTVKNLAIAVCSVLMSELIRSDIVGVRQLLGDDFTPAKAVSRIGKLVVNLLCNVIEHQFTFKAHEMNSLFSWLNEDGNLLWAESHMELHTSNVAQENIEITIPSEGAFAYAKDGLTFRGLIASTSSVRGGETHRERTIRLWVTTSKTRHEILDMYEAHRDAGFALSPNQIRVERPCRDGGSVITRHTVNSFTDLAMDDAAHNVIMQHVDLFKSRKDFCIANRLPHKLVILALGEPGNGKSSLAQALALELNAPLCPVPFVNSKETAAQALGVIEGRHHHERDGLRVVLIEDIHASPLGHRETDLNSGASVHELLNSLNGVSTVHDSVVVITTNDYDSLPPELKRPGRIDLTIDLPRISPEKAEAFITERTGFTAEFTEPVRGCDLYTALTVGHPAQDVMDMAVKEILGSLPALA